MIPPRFTLPCSIGLGLAATLFLSGCGTAPVQTSTAPTAPASASPAVVAMPEIEPIDMAPQGSKPVGFQKALLTMETGAEIGKVTGGWLHIEQTRLKARPGEGSKQLKAIALEELKKAHYTVPGSENPLFGDDESAKARFQLGAQIPAVKLDLHVQPGWSSATVTETGSMTIEWKLFDTLNQKVVFEKTLQTQHARTAKFNEGDDPELLMFRRNLRTLLATPAFAAFMRPGDPKAASDHPAASTPLTIATGAADARHELPAEFATVLESFVTIEPGTGFASGVLISQSGYVLTAAHVITGLKTVPVRLHGGIVLESEIVRQDENADVALLKLPGAGYRPLALAKSEMAELGADIYTIGNPASKQLNATITRGVVSGYREIGGRKFLQTDAAANPGSSGGPLLDKSGQVLGIVSWKVVGAEYQGLAFAVPVQQAITVLNLKIEP